MTQRQRRWQFVWGWLCLACSALLPAAELWQPVRTDHPRDTMASFMRAMNDYRQGAAEDDQAKKSRLDDAVRCLNLDDIGPLTRTEKGRQAAIALKEVIDRIIVVDLERVPDDRALDRWRLRDTEICIVRVETGDRKGEFLFSKDTVAQAWGWYERFRELPYLEGSGQGALYREPWVDRSIPDWARETTFGLPNWQWLGLLGGLLLGLVLWFLAQQACHLMRRLASRSASSWDDRILSALERPAGMVAGSAFWFTTIRVLRFEGLVQTGLTVAVHLLFCGGLVWAFYNLADVLSDYLAHWASGTDSLLDDQFVPLVRKALRIGVVLFGVLLTVQNLGFNVMSVLAGLGIGGLAFALAARDMCANLFGSIMILTDRPFRIGDWIVVDKIEGTVEAIGFRSTRIRTFYNSLISVPNSTVANANIDNMGARKYRRFKQLFGITYDTPAEKLEAFLEGIKNIVKASPHTRKEGYHVVFNGYGDSYLEIMLYCFLEVPDRATELMARQNILLEVLRLARRLEVEFAFPTRTIHMETVPGQPPVRPPKPLDRDGMVAGAAAFGPGGELSRPGGLGYFTPPYREPPAGDGTKR